MPERTSPIPAIIGTLLLLFGVGVVGNRWVQEDLILDAGWRWLLRLTSPMRWELTPRRGIDVAEWIGFNLVPAAWIVLSAAFLFAATRRRDRWGFPTLFFSAWGAIVGAGFAAAVVYWAYAELFLESIFTRPYPDANAIDGVVYTLDAVLTALTVAGLGVALVVALLGTVMGPGTMADAAGPGHFRYDPPVDPHPPMAQTGIMPVQQPGQAEPTSIQRRTE